MIKIDYLFSIAVYYSFAQFLPNSYFPGIGRFSKWLRYICVKRIFKKCGNNVNVERRVNFGSGKNVEIGNNSGLGAYCICPSSLIVGDDVMMGPNVHIFSVNHNFQRIDIPMNQQGISEEKKVVIGNDVWIGAHCIILPGRVIKEGSIVAAGTVLTKDFNEYSIIGGNPGVLLKNRRNDTI